VQADKKRGLEARLIALDDKVVMRQLSAQAVTKPTDPRQNKTAVDGVYRSLAPDYLLLLGSIDVIPHQDLKNPLYIGPRGTDPDAFAYGDVPYACEAPYSQAPQDFMGPTRVLGRLPDITGGNDPSYLLGLLAVAAGWKSADRSALANYFAVTAQIWESSSRLSTTNIFGSSQELQVVPPSNSNWPSRFLEKPIHFFNCHGASQSSQFFGQPAGGADDYPVALDAAYVDGKIHEGLMNPLIFAGTHIGQISWTNDSDREFHPSEAWP
jgi:hypothetical protein